MPGNHQPPQQRFHSLAFTGRFLFLLLVVPMSGGTTASGNPLEDIINAGLTAGETWIRIPPGRYEVAPKEGQHLVLQGIRDVAIDATGVEMICTETTEAILIKDCENLTIMGLTIDYDPLPFTQGRIVEISDDRKSHIIEIMDGFPPAEDAYVFKHSIYTPEAELRYGSYYRYQLEPLAGGRLRIFGLHPRKDGGEQVGDIVVVSSRKLTGRYRPHAIVLENSHATVLEDIRLYSSPCFGFFEHGSSGSVYRNCIIDRREGRIHSLNADAFHSKHAGIGPRIINCTAFWQGDDAVNICGKYYLIVGGEGDWIRILAPREMHIRQGDPLQLVTKAGERVEDAKAVSVRRDGESSECERQLVEELPLNQQLKESMRFAYRIQLNRSIDLKFGAVVAAANRLGNGFAVKDCLFGNNRSRGILVKASDGVISGNKLINTHMEAIKISPEYHWMEAGFSRNVTVAGNEIIRPGREAVLIAGLGAFQGHENINLLGNHIRSGHSPAIRIQSVNNGRVAGNEILNTDGQILAEAIDVQFCRDLELMGPIVE